MTTGVEQIMSGAESSLRLKREAKIEAWRDGSAPERTLHAVHLGDARRMAEVREPVHLVVTSPPYFNLVDYDGGCGDNGQLGGIDEYESFLDQLEPRVAAVLRPPDARRPAVRGRRQRLHFAARRGAPSRASSPCRHLRSRTPDWV